MSEGALFEDPMDLPFKIHGVEEGPGQAGPGVIGSFEIHIIGGPPPIPCMADCLTNPPTPEQLANNLAKKKELREQLEKLKLASTPPTPEGIQVIKKLFTTELKILRLQSLLN